MKKGKDAQPFDCASFLIMLSGGLLPLDRGRRLGGDVVDAAIDAVHRIDDLTRHTGEEVVARLPQLRSPTLPAELGSAYRAITTT